ncbi:aminotransferase class I/II-fold pyridoxal phosphate-dependent enzyme [Aggregatimonas sangjinii]|uniref:Aminotransferase class I/II-fold pyridoxal phosphate-dependent enzyme n=1 Tax=Aggregatimonas sangjinii TaxID=2583587 RepID=A0A5B7SLV7_9FLAO|nr:aminotransferase class I/II-fold pyridoxal phosphate-dependent enzyme [Aggregatimonas sangjinii]QCW99595.1 aminotransferase class I/II-fold pyridoxal phosphate-dependent enzyme [Aggregatimonas sangjinii]
MNYEIDHFPGRQLALNGKAYLYFGGTAYLSLQTDKAFQALYISNVKKYGTNYGASRKSNIQLGIFGKAELHLANVAGSEACITLSSGYLAGQFLAKQFSAQQYACFYAPNTHSSLFSQRRTCFENYTALNTSIRKKLAGDDSSVPVVFLDAIVFTGDHYPHFEGLRQLPLDQIILVVDDSHGVGIVGQNGGGVFSQVSRLQPKELIVCASLGKGFGLQAGAIFGDKNRISSFAETDFFGGASPATPAAMATLIQASSIYREKRVLLQRNIALFRSEVKNISLFSSMEKHPAFSFSDARLTNYLAENHILITHFPYPNEENSVTSRIIISAGHTQGDILTLVKLINQYHSK